MVCPWSVVPCPLLLATRYLLLTGDDRGEGGTELLPFALSAFQGAEAALFGFGAGGDHGAGGVEEVAEGEESLGGCARAVLLDLETDAPVEGRWVGRVHAGMVFAMRRIRYPLVVTSAVPSL